MSTLIVDVLETELVQGISINSSFGLNNFVFKPFLYLHGNPVGEFTLEILKDSSVVASIDFDADYIKEKMKTTDNYLYAFIPFYFVHNSLKKGFYNFKIKTKSYSYDPENFIAWVKEFESNYQGFDYNGLEWTQGPFSFRIVTLEPREFF